MTLKSPECGGNFSVRSAIAISIGSVLALLLLYSGHSRASSSESERSVKMSSGGSGSVQPTTVFGQIILGQSPATVLHDDEMCMAIDSNNPLAPVHFLVIPKKNLDNLSFIEQGDQALMGHMMLIASKVAKDKGVDGFYRVVINNDDTTIQHLHIHVLGGRRMGWPPG